MQDARTPSQIVTPAKWRQQKREKSVTKIVIINHTLGGQYLESFDPERHAPGKTYPTGFAEWTEDPTRAMVFPNAAAAFKYIRQRPKVCPTRPDGKPNRPLMAFTLEVAPL